MRRFAVFFVAINKRYSSAVNDPVASWRSIPRRLRPHPYGRGLYSVILSIIGFLM